VVLLDIRDCLSLSVQLSASCLTFAIYWFVCGTVTHNLCIFCMFTFRFCACRDNDRQKKLTSLRNAPKIRSDFTHRQLLTAKPVDEF